MTVATKVSICVDCATTIIGEQPRCPACHDRHATALIAVPWGDDSDRHATALSSSGDEDVTVPRPRSMTSPSRLDFVARWAVAVELFVIVALGLVLGMRGCL